MSETLLDVRDLAIAFGDRRVGRGRLLHAGARRDAGAGRRIRLRQDGHRAGDRSAAARARLFRRVRFCSTARDTLTMSDRRIARDARRPHHHGVSGADDLAQSAAHDRAADRGDHRAARRARARRARARDRTAEGGRHSRPGRPARRLSASTLRRPAAARDDRHGARQPARTCSSPTSRRRRSTSPCRRRSWRC